MPIGSGRVGSFGVKATPGIKGPHRGIALHSPALSQVKPGIDAGATFVLDATATTSLPSQVTLTATGSRTYFDTSGVLQTASSGVARFDNKVGDDKASIVPAGLLVEDQRTNSCFQSFNPNNANWIVSNATKTTGLTDIQGGTNAVTITATASTGIHETEYSAVGSLTNGVQYTMRVYLGQGTSPYVVFGDFTETLNFVWGSIRWSDMSVSTNGLDGATIAGPFLVTLVGGSPVYAVDLTWTRVVSGAAAGSCLVCTYNNTAASLGNTTPSYTAAGTETFKFYGAMIVDGPSKPTQSPILTTTAAVTRSAEIFTSTDATLLAARAWAVEVGELQPATTSTLLGINTAIGLGETTGNALTTADGGAQTSGNTGIWAGQTRAGIAWDATPRVSIDLNGSTVVTAANTPITPSNLYFGNTNNGASGFLNGHIRALASYAALTDSQLATISVPGAPISTTAAGVSAALAATEAQDTVAIVASIGDNAALAATEAQDVALINASETDVAVLAATEAPDTAAIVAQVKDNAALAATEAQDVAVINASVGDNAALAATEAQDVALINVSESDVAVLAATEVNDVAAFAITETDNAALSATEAQDAAAFVVTEGDNVALAATEAKDVAFINASSSTLAVLAVTEVPDVAAMVVGIVDAITFTATEVPDTAAIVISNPVPFLMALAATEAPDTADIEASIREIVHIDPGLPTNRFIWPRTPERHLF
jgi:uncharacterized cupin superfamily protein